MRWLLNILSWIKMMLHSHLAVEIYTCTTLGLF
jgi:hypothetical protein